MKRTLTLLFLSALSFSCSHYETKEHWSPRSPSSVTSAGSCLENAKALIDSSTPPKTYKMADFSHLFEEEDLGTEITKIVQSNSAPELQEQSLIIFGLLKKLHPEEEPVELIARYKNHFAYCP